MKAWMRLLAAIMLVLAAGPGVVPGGQVLAQEDTPPDLFVDAGGPDEVGALAESDPTTLRQRYVTLQLSSLAAVRTALVEGRSEDAALTLKLFDDASYVALFTEFEDSATGGYVLSGSLQDQPQSEVHLAVEGEVITALVTLYGASYVVEYNPDGLHHIRQLNVSAFPPEAPDLVPDGQPPEPEVEAQAGTSPDDGSQIDVMVVYTDDARAAAGGASSINSAINSAFSLTNQGYANSDINQRVKLVSTAEVYYDESIFYTPGPWDNVLDHLTGTSDGYIDNVHALRDTNSADLVVLVVEDTNVSVNGICGIGWLMGGYWLGSQFRSLGFSVVRRGCLSNNTLAHEMGHNMGAHHDRANASGQGAYSYSYGYQNQSYSFYTIMAYSNGCYGCYRANQWSNPAITYWGGVTGTSVDDNHRTLNNTASIVANFRNGPEPAAPGNLTGYSTLSKTIQLNWTDNSNDESGFIIERSQTGVSSWSAIATTAANASSYADGAGLACDAQYSYRVRATSGNGQSAASNQASVKMRCTPAAPSGLSAAASFVDPTIRVALNWTDNSDNESNFRLERKSGSDAWATVTGSLAANSTSYTDALAETQCSRVLDYRLYAYNVFGDSPVSDTASVLTVICRPSGLAVTQYPLSQSRLNVAWQDTPDESGFRLERSPTGSGSWTQIAAPKANASAYMDVGLACGSLYYYRLRAYDAGDANRDSGYSAVVPQQTIACGPPLMPVDPLTGYSLGKTQAVLRWQNIDDETGFKVYRSPHNANTWQQVGEVGANVTQFVDSGLTADTWYDYYVLPYNSYGNAAQHSNVSAVHTHTMLWWVPNAR